MKQTSGTIMEQPRLTIPADVPAALRAKRRIADLDRRAREGHVLAHRILDLAASDPRVDDPAKLIRLARIIERTAESHARQARFLTNQLAAACAALASSP